MLLLGRPDLVGSLPYEKSPLTLLFGTRMDAGGRLLAPNFNATEYAVYPGACALWLAVLGLGLRGARAVAQACER